MSHSFSVIGPGRAGRSLVSALEDSSWICRRLYGREHPIVDAAADVDAVFLAVPDDAIAAVAHAVRPGLAVVLHLSGAKGLDVLAPHARTGSVHPLASLPDPATGAEVLRSGIVFAVAGDPLARATVDALGGRPVTVADERRSLYHATASVAANHLVALCGQVERLAAESGVPVDAYWALMAATLGNVRQSSPVSSLTGPASRGDLRTLADHLDALPEGEHDLYRLLAAEAARLAGRPLPPDWG